MGVNALGWGYFGEYFAGVSNSSVSSSDTAAVASDVTVAASVSDSDTAAVVEDGQVSVVTVQPSPVQDVGGANLFGPPRPIETVDDDLVVAVSVAVAASRRRRVVVPG